MKRFEILILAICVPLSLSASSGCSSDTQTSKRHQPQNSTQGDETSPVDEMPSEGEGEGEEGADASTGDSGGGGAVDSGAAEDTGTGAADTGTGGVVDTGAPTPPPAPVPTTHTVQLQNFFFSPSTLTVHVGDTVVWNWATPTHSVTSGTGCVPDGKFDSGIQGAGATFSQTFTTAGTFPYFCSVHCAMGMTGTVVVEP